MTNERSDGSGTVCKCGAIANSPFHNWPDDPEAHKFEPAPAGQPRLCTKKQIPGPADIPCCLPDGHEGICKPDYKHKTRAVTAAPAAQPQCFDCETIIPCQCGNNRTELKPWERPEGWNEADEQPRTDHKELSDFHLLHRLWTDAVGTADYVKDEWRRMESIVLRAEKSAAQPSPDAKVGKIAGEIANSIIGPLLKAANSDKRISLNFINEVAVEVEAILRPYFPADAPGSESEVMTTVSDTKSSSAGEQPAGSATSASLKTSGLAGEATDGPEFMEIRCTLCGAQRLTTGACSFIGCKDPLHDYRLEQAEAAPAGPEGAAPLQFATVWDIGNDPKDALVRYQVRLNNTQIIYNTGSSELADKLAADVNAALFKYEQDIFRKYELELDVWSLKTERAEAEVRELRGKLLTEATGHMKTQAILKGANERWMQEQDARKAAESQVQDAAIILRVLNEETVLAGFPGGDRNQTLANVRAMKARIKAALDAVAEADLEYIYAALISASEANECACKKDMEEGPCASCQANHAAAAVETLKCRWAALSGTAQSSGTGEEKK